MSVRGPEAFSRTRTMTNLARPGSRESLVAGGGAALAFGILPDFYPKGRHSL